MYCNRTKPGGTEAAPQPLYLPSKLHLQCYKIVQNSEPNTVEKALGKSENTRKHLLGKHEPPGKLIKTRLVCTF